MLPIPVITSLKSHLTIPIRFVHLSDSNDQKHKFKFYRNIKLFIVALLNKMSKNKEKVQNSEPTIIYKEYKLLKIKSANYTLKNTEKYL
jgi:hypothetical protein